ncbi:glycosyltransferase [Deinococcus sp. KNUC1210]|uniref:glycosyltransferase n=1 Tax=Deinococcus sp. KNUC1210 TaxID=2917691 RepID=UPI001EF03D72|nr:glycosyltransferase [Deinococcus sp. KNUC1210]ULH14552.1 glycosyltransferase [Deinococcus sp. KNUC1210]
MRIGFVTATYLPSRNGVATSSALFARGLRDLGHEVRIFAPVHPAQQPEAGVYRLPSMSWGAPPDYPLLLWPSRPVVARQPLFDLDIIHTMHPFLSGQLAALWSRRISAYRKRPVPLVFTAHTQYEQYLHYARVPRRAGTSLMRAHVAAFARQADRVLVPGRAMAQMLALYGYAGEVTTLPNPVDLESFAAATGKGIRAEYGIPDAAPLVLSLGRLAPEKNLETLLLAFEAARALRPELRLLIVGDGPSRAALSARAGEGIIFAGGVPYARVPEILAASDVFLTASESEVLPMSMIEALASGAPLVAAHSPAALDLIQDGVNGLLSTADPAALAAALLEALRPGRLPLLRQHARTSALSYDVRARSADLLGIYQALLG